MIVFFICWSRQVSLWDAIECLGHLMSGGTSCHCIFCWLRRLCLDASV